MHDRNGVVVARVLPDRWAADRARPRIAVAAARDGDTDRAVQIANRIIDPWALTRIAQALAKHGDVAPTRACGDTRMDVR